ncbi:hypothetical protein TraAM80_07561 [Trypanosoma rangeli]|uniref:Uncharacterized protein n=1 Tax=Trypanosoma rangeli TaxID=5698 RepID=A0A3R7MDA8_TRYRA|nr:uncharacterized protein TraAM80_07561 [Trypanosoma rangeli]RNF00481.1 hypothetical protein TraAM80_07561 [Trypanosoma rangeli]|eukprot:RNF00481.1 hypothetical protein TraAM80_07561 [Trypanosoma rangeli]
MHRIRRTFPTAPSEVQVRTFLQTHPRRPWTPLLSPSTLPADQLSLGRSPSGLFVPFPQTATQKHPNACAAWAVAKGANSQLCLGSGRATRSPSATGSALTA